MSIRRSKSRYRPRKSKSRYRPRKSKSPKKSPYTKPQLRERIKNRIMSGNKGGKSRQWSARKAQLLKKAYEKAGGGYTGVKTKAQKSLTKWSKEKWRTSDRKPAIRSGGTRRYLPDAAWRQLSPVQRTATNRAKIRGSRKGKQFVPNTKAAKSASRRARSRYS